MFRRFLSGFTTVFPFSCLDDRAMKYYPEDIYRNDWRNIGSDLRKAIGNRLDLLNNEGNGDDEAK